MTARTHGIRSTTASIAAALLVVAVGASLPSGAVPAGPRHLALRAVQFPASFVPQQITGAADSLWVLGSPSPSSFTDCSLLKLDPSSLAIQSYALPLCASDITSGSRRVYLLVNQVEPSSNTHDYHIEVFDPRTDVAEVRSPVVLQNVGSAVAHTDLSFGNGSLWLYGYALGGKTEVVQISPDSGEVEHTIGDAPQIGGIHPTVVATAAGEWLGGGPGGAARLEWVHAGTGAITNRALVWGGGTGSILWLSDAAGRVWAGVAKYGEAPGITSVTTSLVLLNDHGTVAVRSPPEPIGAYPVVVTADGHMWDVAYAKCGAPEHLLEINPSSGVSRAVASFTTPATACDNETDGSELAVVGDDVFALFPTGAASSGVLYRVAA